MRKLLFILLAALTITACTEEDEETTTTITIPDRTELTQTAYADETSGKNSVNFTTSGAWTSAISEKPAAKSASTAIPDWIIIDPASGDKAGDYTVNIILGTNYTGEKRTAVITITCNGQTITINITQEATTKEGEKPEKPEQSLFVKKINGKIVKYDTLSPTNIIAVQLGTDNEYVNKANSYTEWRYLSRDGRECEYIYDNRGHVSQTEYSYIYIPGSTPLKALYYWENDTIMYIRGDQQNVGRIGYLRTDLEYGTTRYTKGNIDINWLLATSEYYTETPISAIMVRTSRIDELLTKKTQKEEEGDGKYNGYSTYRYVFNDNGYISQIYETHNSEVLGLQREKLIYEFEY